MSGGGINIKSTKNKKSLLNWDTWEQTHKANEKQNARSQIHCWIALNLPPELPSRLTLCLWVPCPLGAAVQEQNGPSRSLPALSRCLWRIHPGVAGEGVKLWESGEASGALCYVQKKDRKK